MLSQQLSVPQRRQRSTLRLAALHRTFSALPPGDTAPAGCDTRRVDEAMLRAHLPKPAEETLVVVCGPSAFEAGVAALLQAMGYSMVVLLSSGELPRRDGVTPGELRSPVPAGGLCSSWSCGVWGSLMRALASSTVRRVAPD